MNTLAKGGCLHAVRAFEQQHPELMLVLREHRAAMQIYMCFRDEPETFVCGGLAEGNFDVKTVAAVAAHEMTILLNESLASLIVIRDDPLAVHLGDAARQSVFPTN